MALFLKLYLGHLLGDFVFQPGILVKAKRESWQGLFLHSLVLATAGAAVLVDTIRVDWPAVVLVAAAHLAIERLTIEAYLKTPTRGLFVLLFDQALHLLSIVLVAWAAGAAPTQPTATLWGRSMPIGTLAAVCGVAAVTLFGSILVFETQNALIDRDSKGRLLSFDLSRVAGMAERGLSLTLALTVTPAAGLAPFLPRAVYAAIRPGTERARQILQIATGLALCAVAYGLVIAVGLTSP